MEIISMLFQTRVTFLLLQNMIWSDFYSESHWLSLYTTVQEFGVTKIFEISLLYTTRQHLFNQKYSKKFRIVTNYYKLTKLFSILIYSQYNLFLWWQSWIFSSLWCHMILQKSFYADLMTKGQSLNASVLIKSYSNISQFLFHQVIQVWIRILKFEWTNIQNIQKPSFAALSAVAQQTLK